MKNFNEVLKNKKVLLIAAAVIVLLIIGIVVALLAAGNSDSADPVTDPADRTYTVTVENKAGKPLSNVNVFVYTDETKKDLICVSRTDAEGKISFTNKTGTYVAVLEDLPVGYSADASYSITASETTLILSIKTMTEEDMGITYQLGDAMMDFTVTTPDGTQYTISKLLEKKKAVVLNFWFQECDSCKAEFPYLQEAYERYNEDIEVLALTPVDKDDEAIAAFRKDNGLTFPMAQVDSRWESIMGIVGYPTTVVVDRYGNICLIHSDSIDSAKTFEDVFAFFTADDYEQRYVENIEDISSTEEVAGTADNPLEFGGVTEFEVTVDPGQVVYCNVYRVSNMLLQLQDQDAYVVFENTTYEPENGIVIFNVSSPDMYTPAALQIGNSGNETKTFKVTFIAPVGTLNNPYTLEMGELTVDVEAGNDQGVYYTYEATADGVVTLRCTGATDGVEYSFFLYNLNSYAYRTLESDGVTDDSTGIVTLSISVSAGDVLQFSAGTLPDSSNNYPAASLDFNATFEEKTASGDDKDPSGGTTEEKKISYTVKVTDDSNKPISGVAVKIGSTTVTTNASGVATATLVEGSYTVSVTAPSGYLEHSATYSLTKTNTSVTVRLVNPATSDNYTELYVGYAMHVATGTTNVNLVPGQLTYFLFTPTRPGKYQFTASSTISYWGTNTNFIMDHTSSTNIANNKFSISISEGNIGASYILAVTAPAGVSSGTVTITRIGDPDTDVGDLPWETYKGTYEPKTFTFPGGNLTYVDVTGNSADYNIVLGSDGYYHLNSASGPIVYVDFSVNAPYLSLINMLTQGQCSIRTYTKDSNNKVVKLDFTECVQSYVDCSDNAKKLYPLTEDLRYILKTCGEGYGWWDKTSGYIFGELTNVNTEIAWMFACCYIA